METPFTDNYDMDFLLDTMMGPNAMRITEEMASYLPVTSGMRVLDLGCGMGISSILLAKKYDVNVFAADFWISPTENASRFSKLGLENKIVPIFVDASAELPFTHEYFDMLISVDSYHYFGADDSTLKRLLPYIKKGGYIAVAVPGLKYEFPDGRIPPELLPYWQQDMNLYSCDWWKTLWQRESGIDIKICREMDCFKQAWDDWLKSANPYAQADIHMMQAEGGKYFTLVQIVGCKI